MKEQRGIEKQHHAFKLAKHSPESGVAIKVLAFQSVHERPNQNGRLVDRQLFSAISACLFQNG